MDIKLRTHYTMNREHVYIYFIYNIICKLILDKYLFVLYIYIINIDNN